MDHRFSISAEQGQFANPDTGSEGLPRRRAKRGPKSFLAYILLALVFGCTSDRPSSNIVFVGVESLEGNLLISFESNVQFVDLFSENRHQRPILSEFVCSLDADGNLAFEHRLERSAKGSIEPVGARAPGGPYRFQSAVQFWRAPKDGMDSDVMMTNAELANALEGKQTIPCIVRMTIYLSQPYYTNPMHVPVQQILAAMPAEPR